MGIRHQGRKIAMQGLYQAETRSEEITDFVEAFIDSVDVDEKAQEWARFLVTNAWEHKQQSDEKITTYSIGWTLDRISLIDLSILRLAFFELMKTDTDSRIVVDEAVELAKEFSSDDSPKFINGILGKFVDDHVHGSNS